MTNVSRMNFNSFAGEERRVRPNKNLRAAWASDCLMIPEGAVELTHDEMSYVDGGSKKLIGRYGAGNYGGVDWLYNMSSGFSTLSIMWSTNGSLAGAGALLSSPSGIGAIVFGVVGGVAAFLAGYFTMLSLSATRATDKARDKYDNGKKYSVYQNSIFGCVTSFSVS